MSIVGKTIVFTGKISKPRHEFEQLVINNGGHPGSGVSKNTDYLVVGDKPGSKLATAALLGVKTISESEFLQLLSPADLDADDETPLSDVELAELNIHFEDRQCKICNREYRQFIHIDDKSICPVCELQFVHICPTCGYDYVVYVEDFQMYHCPLCSTWFDGPRPQNVTVVKHHHMWIKHIPKGMYETLECLCGAKVTVPTGFDTATRVARAQKIVKDLDTRKCIHQRRLKEEEWFNTLSDDARNALAEELNKT